MQMIRSPDDKKTFVLEGVGEMRPQSWYKQGATLTGSDGRVWEVGVQGFRQRVTITDPAGGTPATFEPAGVIKQGGTLTVTGGDAYEMRPSSKWKARYAIVHAGEEVATVEAGGWSAKKPVKVDVEGPVDDLVLLCFCWLAKRFADAAATAAVGV